MYKRIDFSPLITAFSEKKPKNPNLLQVLQCFFVLSEAFLVA